MIKYEGVVVGAVLSMGDAVGGEVVEHALEHILQTAQHLEGGGEVGEDMLGIDLVLVAPGMDDIGICHIGGHDLDGFLEHRSQGS